MKKLIYFLIATIIICSCLKHAIVPIKKEDYTPQLTSDVKIIFSKHPYRGGLPKIGSYVGYDYHVKFNRNVIVYVLYERWEYKIVDKFRISVDEAKQLDSLFNIIEFVNYPKFIPHYDATVKWPNDQYGIGYKANIDSDLKMVSISSLRAEKKYYPKGFYKLFEMLQKILFQNNSWRI